LERRWRCGDDASTARRTRGRAPLGSLAEQLGDADLAGLEEAALAAVSADDIRELLQACSPGILRAVLSHVGLQDAKKVTPRSAEAVLRILRAGDSRRRGSLRGLLAIGFVHGFGNPDELTAEDCHALLDPDRAERALAKAPGLCSHLAADHPASIAYWGLTRVIGLDRPLAPVALGLLAAGPERLGDGAGAVAAAWKNLRERHPRLPERPIGLLELRELARRRLTDPPAADHEDETDMPSDETTVPSTAPTTGDRSPDLSAVAAAVEELRERLPRAAAAADRIATRLRDGRRPQDDDVTFIGETIARFDAVREQVEAVTSGDPPAADLSALAEALENARRAEADASRIRRLTGLQGPDRVADALDRVRRMARTGEGDGLAALAELIEAMSLPDGPSRAPDLADKARAHLPGECRKLVDYALMGQLTMPDAPPPASGAAEEGPEDDHGGGIARETERDDDPDPSERADDETGHDADRDTGRDLGHAAPEADAEPSAEADERDGTADDLAELDALIAEAFPEEAPDDDASPVETAGTRGEGRAPAAGDASHAELSGDLPSDTPPDLSAGTSTEVSAGTGPTTTEQPDRRPAARPAAEATSPAGPSVAEAEAAALRAGRFGLAGWLRSAAGRPEAETAARHCTAIAAEMAVFAGPLSAEFTALARNLSVKALAEDPAGGVLAWAAAIRAGLVHPTPESTKLLEELTVVVSGHPDLVDCGEMFVRAARGGAYLGSGVAGRTRGMAEATMARTQSAREAARLLEEEPHRKIKYQPATEVWKTLLQRDEPVGSLLMLAAQDDPANADQVAAQVTRLRATDEIERMIDEKTRRITARRRPKKIIAGARAQLVAKVANALDTAGRWARAVREIRERDAADVQDWRLGPLGQLQEASEAKRAAILDALQDMARTPDEVKAAAVRAAHDLLTETFDLLSGRPLPESEPPIAHVVNRDLLLAPTIPLDPASLGPREPFTVDQLIPTALADDRAWRAAFEERAARGDHEGTLAIVTVLERRDLQTALELRARREELVRRAREDRDARVEEIRDLVARRARDGVLTEDQVRRAEERLSTLLGDRRDFDRIDRSLDRLRDLLEDWSREAIERERARLEERAAHDPRVAAVRDRIAERIGEGDLTTAREFLAQIEAGRQLHEASEGVDHHLRRFYPAFPAAFARSLVRGGKRARKQENVEFLNALIDALGAGTHVADPDLAALLEGAGIDIPALRNARRQESKEGLRQWRACGLGSKTAGNLRSAIRPVLRMIGLEGVQRDVTGAPADPHRVWIDLELEQVVGDALLPAFGSRMSPSGKRLRLLLVWRRPGPQQLIEMLKDQPEDQTVLVWYFGVLSPEERQQLAAAARRRPAPVAGVLDDVAISYLACMPEADWSVAVALMAPFTAANPYAPVGDVPDEMFYGRADQLREVTDQTGSSFVYGGRQLGKSALLRKVERHIRATDRNRVVILENIQTVGKVAPLASLWSKLADKLAQQGVIPTGLVRGEQVCKAILEWIRRDPQRQLLILLDEADQFLNEDAKGAKFENVIALRNLMEETGRRVKVVFAGLHQTARFQSLTNQPLAHLGTPIAVGPLEPQDAFDLLVRPLATLGFRFPETLAARVIAEANNAPALIQLFAEELLKRLRRNPRATRELPYEITAEDVAEVWRDKTLARGFRDRFEWTLNLDKRYKVIAYTVALHALTEGADAALSVGELSEQCRYWWEAGFEDCSSDGFRSLLDECVNLGVLGLDADRYRLRTPHILNLLGGTAEVEEVLQNAGEFEKPDSFDAHSYHGAFRGGPERSPLSSRQLAALLRPHDLVHVVAGSRALHVERVPFALEEEELDNPGVKIHLVGPGRLTFDGAVERANRHDGHTVIVMTVPEDGDGRHFARRLDEALAAVSTPRRGTLAVVLVTGPGLARVWSDLQCRDGVDLMELRRFNRLAIRQWMWEEAHGFPDEKGQDALLVCTGGWPMLIGQIVDRVGERGVERDRALRWCQERLRRDPEEFVAATGVLADECLSAAWRQLVAEDAPETPEDLAELLELHGEETLPALSARSLRAHGYSGTADLVEVLRLLGALEPREGRLSCEPVLAEATRRMDGHR